MFSRMSWISVSFLRTAFVLSLSLSAEVFGQSPFLDFPIKGHTPYTAPISSVFDHSMVKPYNSDRKVIAFTGERGDRSKGIHPKNSTCYAQQGKQRFIVNGHYDDIYLCYDGHSGIDYPFAGGTAVYAAAAGIVVGTELPSP